MQSCDNACLVFEVLPSSTFALATLQQSIRRSVCIAPVASVIYVAVASPRDSAACRAIQDRTIPFSCELTSLLWLGTPPCSCGSLRALFFSATEYRNAVTRLQAKGKPAELSTAEQGSGSDSMRRK